MASAAISAFGAKKQDDSPFTPDDFFPSLNDRAAATAVTAGEAAAQRASALQGSPLSMLQGSPLSMRGEGEMDTEATVRYLTRRFANYVPEPLRELVGLD